MGFLTSKARPVCFCCRPIPIRNVALAKGPLKSKQVLAIDNGAAVEVDPSEEALFPHRHLIQWGMRTRVSRGMLLCVGCGLQVPNP